MHILTLHDLEIIMQVRANLILKMKKICFKMISGHWCFNWSSNRILAYVQVADSLILLQCYKEAHPKPKILTRTKLMIAKDTSFHKGKVSRWGRGALHLLLLKFKILVKSLIKYTTFLVSSPILFYFYYSTRSLNQKIIIK